MEYVYFACAIGYGIWISWFAIRGRVVNQTLTDNLANAIKALGRANRSLDSSSKATNRFSDVLDQSNQLIDALRQENIELKSRIDENNTISTQDLIQTTYNLLKNKKESA